MKTLIAIILAVMSSIYTCQTMANSSGQNIRVLGLFKGMAVVSINGQRKVMRVGDTQAGDIRLLAADSDKALFSIAGRQVELSLSDNNSISTDLPGGGVHEAQLISSGGVYAVTGAINGQMVNFVVDTGASYIAMSQGQARMLHLDYRQGRKALMNTANGKVVAYIITLDSVRVGSIELRNVKAAVLGNLASSSLLLGMSFLNRVEMQHKQGYMLLKQKF